MVSCARTKRQKVLSSFGPQDFFPELIGKLTLQRRLHNARKTYPGSDLFSRLLTDVKRSRDRDVKLLTLAVEQAFVEDSLNRLDVGKRQNEVLTQLCGIARD